MAWEMFGLQPVSNVMEGRGTVSAGHRALQLHAVIFLFRKSIQFQLPFYVL